MTLFRPQHIGCVLFDLDGVLVDSERAWFEAVGQTARRFGAPSLDWEVFHPTFGQGVIADQAMFFPMATVAEVAEAYEAFYPPAVAKAELLDGAFSLLEGVRRAGARTAIVTNAPRRAAEAVLREKGLAGFFDATATSTDGPSKPDPALVHLALARIEGAAEGAVFVGDSSVDRGAARAAGVFFVGRGIDGDARVETLPELGRWLGAD